jgi:AsmA protein
MRALKIAGWAILGVVALMVLAGIAVAIFVDPNDYKDDIAKAVHDRTGRDLKLDGRLSLSIFPWLAIETGHAELGNPPGFGAAPFVSIDKADVGVKLMPLLRKQFEVRRLRLDGLRVHLIKDQRGHTNWEDLTKSSTTGAEAESGGGTATIAGLTLKNAALDYRDLGSGSRWRVTNLNASTGRLGGHAPFDFDLAATVDRGEGSDTTHIKLASEATLDTQAKRYGAKDLKLDVVQPATKTRARERKLNVGIPSIAADLQQQTLDAPQFVVRVAGAELSGSLKGEQVVDQPKFSGTLKLPNTSPRKLLEELEAEAPKTRDAKALTALAFDTAFEATSNTVRLKDLKVTLDDSHLTGRADIENLKKNAVGFDLAMDQLDLDRYREPEQKKVAEKTEAKPFELPVKQLKALNARGTLTVGQLTLAGMRMSAVTLTVDAKDGLVRLNPLQAKLYGGGYRGSVVVDARADVARLSAEEHLNAVQFAPLFADLFDSKRLSGTGAASMVVTARGNKSDALMRSLDGNLNFDVANGAIEGTDLWYELRRARALWKRESLPTQTSTGRTPFKTLKGTGTIEKGVLSNRDLQLDMDYLKASGAGTVDFVSKAVNYRLQTTLYQVPEQGAGAEMKDLKAAEIPVRVSGTIDDPKVGLDTEALAKAQAGQKLEETKQEMTEKLKEKLGKWLGGKKP